ncbi:hypothetical protein, partial [Pseudomonas syringae group genomosp. 7]
GWGVVFVGWFCWVVLWFGVWGGLVVGGVWVLFCGGWVGVVGVGGLFLGCVLVFFWFGVLAWVLWLLAVRYWCVIEGRAFWQPLSSALLSARA